MELENIADIKLEDVIIILTDNGFMVMPSLNSGRIFHKIQDKVIQSSFSFGFKDLDELKIRVAELRISGYRAIYPWRYHIPGEEIYAYDVSDTKCIISKYLFRFYAEK